MKSASVGDYRPHNATHRALTDGLTMAGAEVEWVPSNEVDSRAERLAGYGGVVAAPGSPYAGMEGVGRRACEHVFRLAREHHWTELWVVPDHPAIGFYEKMGFSDTGERVPSRVPGGPVFSVYRIHF